MKTSILSFDKMEQYLGEYDSMDNLSSTNSAVIKHSIKVLKKAIDKGLTERQKQCIVLCFYEKMTLQEIGNELGIDKSTVSRHIKAGKKRLERILSISCF